MQTAGQIIPAPSCAASDERLPRGFLRDLFPCFILKFLWALCGESPFLGNINFDALVKSRHSRVGGNPEATKPLEKTGFPFSLE